MKLLQNVSASKNTYTFLSVILRPTGLQGVFLLPIFCGLLLLACAPLDPPPPSDPAQLTSQAMDNFNRGRYTTALRDFQQVRDHFPFSQYSLLAELKSADCHYYNGEYSEAMVLYEEFESKHPTNEAIPYILFQIGMCHFKGIDSIDRDPGAAHDAIGVFTRLIRTYPRSSYVEEAKTRIKTGREFLAEHELYVAKFYVRTGEWEAALSRLERILEQYPDSQVAGKAQPLLVDVQAVREEEEIKDGKVSFFRRMKILF